MPSSTACSQHDQRWGAVLGLAVAVAGAATAQLLPWLSVVVSEAWLASSVAASSIVAMATVALAIALATWFRTRPAQCEPGCSGKLAALMPGLFERVLQFVPIPERLHNLQVADHYTTRVVLATSFPQSRGHNPWVLAPGITLTSLRTGQWLMSTLPAVFRWAPPPLFLTRPKQCDVLRPLVRRGGGGPLDVSSSIGSLRLQSELRACPAFLIMPTSLVLQIMDLQDLGCWLQTRIVGASGRWIDVQYGSICSRRKDQFRAWMRWQPGEGLSELLTQPLLEWDSRPNWFIFEVGHGKVGWDGCAVNATQMSVIFNYLAAPPGVERKLWNALMQGCWSQQLADHMASVRSQFGTDLVHEAERALETCRAHAMNIGACSSEHSGSADANSLVKQSE
mmetsp:Transcript_116928/g.330855  ORF Transcript_116928/g.330855 Transcript_116928/m.330855 type:complete len:394 (-) Transcript_116928:113-1294(-)|eukprot:CAMPEP_0117529572 /NCGR_PEP_ID=MMETSP0784-20121206/37902_1 /TAXON_ID=39447 /ORGANISM="" /LENGTH=393 /DNA_ID=CAMNT_0005325899 /DNA_START=21 /DNA_END=1202 /DNA_ORIENTATION=-